MLCEPVRAQLPAPRGYLFVEVKDTTGQPVSDAKVSISGAERESYENTNSNGAAQLSFGLHYGDKNASFFVSKPGYLNSEHIVFLYARDGDRYIYNAREGFPQTEAELKNLQSQPIKVVLKKPATTRAARDALAVDQLRHQLISAVKGGDPDLVKDALAKGVSANVQDSEGVSVVVWAAFVGDADVIEQLLRAGATVKDPKSLAHQALLIFLAEGADYRYRFNRSRMDLTRSPEIAQKLITAGAGVNVQSQLRGTVLNNALSLMPHGSQPSPSPAEETVRLLLRLGADVNTADHHGRTPLMVAAEKQSANLVKLLLDAGARASINATDREGRTALMTFLRYGNLAADVAEVLLAAGANVNRTDKDGLTALMYAAQSRATTVAEVLLKSRAEVNVKDNKGMTPLMYAARAYGPELVGMLIRAGARLNEQDAQGWTALMHASAKYYNESGAKVVEVLIAAKADVHVINNEGQTALIVAARHYDELAIKLLISAGATINVTDKRGQTVLMNALQAFSGINLGFLLQAGTSSKINAKDDRGWTALMYASSRVYGARYVRELIPAGAKVNEESNDGQTALMLAVGTGDFDLVQSLLEAGANAAAKDKKGQTTLMQVAPTYPISPVKNIVAALITAGAKLEEVDEEGRTALIRGADERSYEKVKALIEAGASINAQDKMGRTALITAVESKEAQLDKANVLVMAGADRSIKDNKGQTALMIAQKLGASDLVRLLENGK